MIRQLTISLLIVSVCFSMQSINKIIGNKGFEIKHGRSPNEYDNQKDEIISHFEFVYDSLSNLKSEDLNKLQLTNRTKHLNSLKKYMTRGIFPLNNLYFDRVPVFVDELNTHCAVAYILKEDNQFEIINNLQQNYNYNYVEDMNLDTLSFWLQNSGLSLDELILIQPTYFGGRPRLYREPKPKIEPVDSIIIKPYLRVINNKNINYLVEADAVNIDSIFLYHGIKLNPWYNYNKSFENLKEIKNLTIEVEKLSNKRLYKRLKNINKNDPKSDKYELQIKLIIDEYGRFLDVDIKNLENNYNNYINRFVKKLLKKSKWSPSMTIFKDKNNNYRMERNSIFFSIHFITI